jgi:hypothetical protein
VGNTELSARVIVKDDVKGTSKKAMMAYFKKQLMAILGVKKSPRKCSASVGDLIYSVL